MKKHGPNCAMECTGADIFIIFSGKRIAKRGQPNRPQARTWIPLEPGYTVLSAPGHKELIVEYKGVRQC